MTEPGDDLEHLLLLYASGELDDRQRERVEVRLARDPEAQALLEDLGTLAELAGPVPWDPRDEPPRYLHALAQASFEEAHPAPPGPVEAASAWLWRWASLALVPGLAAVFMALRAPDLAPVHGWEPAAVGGRLAEVAADLEALEQDWDTPAGVEADLHEDAYALIAWSLQADPADPADPWPEGDLPLDLEGAGASPEDDDFDDLRDALDRLDAGLSGHEWM